MALSQKPLSKYAREQLARTMDEAWFQEVLENMRYAATFADRTYTDKRTITELEHQALNGSFREGAAFQVEYLVGIAKEPKAPAAPLPPQFGTLLEIPADPKVYQPKK